MNAHQRRTKRRTKREPSVVKIKLYPHQQMVVDYLESLADGTFYAVGAHGRISWPLGAGKG